MVEGRGFDFYGLGCIGFHGVLGQMAAQTPAGVVDNSLLVRQGSCIMLRSVFMLEWGL